MYLYKRNGGRIPLYWEMSKILIIQVKNEIKKFLNKVYLNIFYQEFLTSYFFSELVYIYIY